VFFFSVIELNVSPHLSELRYLAFQYTFFFPVFPILRLPYFKCVSLYKYARTPKRIHQWNTNTFTHTHTYTHPHTVRTCTHMLICIQFHTCINIHMYGTCDMKTRICMNVHIWIHFQKYVVCIHDQSRHTTAYISIHVYMSTCTQCEHMTNQESQTHLDRPIKHEHTHTHTHTHTAHTYPHIWKHMYTNEETRQS